MSKFIDGLKFGTGFGISLIAVIALGMAMLGKFDENSYSDTTTVTSFDSSNVIEQDIHAPPHVPKTETLLEESKGIFVAEFQAQQSNLMVPFIVEVLRQHPDTKMEKGMAFTYGAYEPSVGTNYGARVIVFLGESPDHIESALHIYGEKIPGLDGNTLSQIRAMLEAGT